MNLLPNCLIFSQILSLKNEQVYPKLLFLGDLQVILVNYAQKRQFHWFWV